MLIRHHSGMIAANPPELRPAQSRPAAAAQEAGKTAALLPRADAAAARAAPALAVPAATGSLVALQELDVAAGAGPAGLLLEGLERLRSALLGPGEPAAEAAALADALKAAQGGPASGLELRAAVEVAKLERAGLLDRDA